MVLKISITLYISEIDSVNINKILLFFLSSISPYILSLIYSILFKENPFLQ